MANALYKVILDGSFQGQDIKNILYYRNGIGIDIGGLTVGGAKEVSDAVAAIVWPVLRLVLPSAYELQQITTYVYDDQTFDLVYQNPFTLGIQAYGVRTSDLNGPAPCAILKFILEPHIAFANGFFPPKRGYLAIGPLDDDQVKSNGELQLTGGSGLEWDAVCAVMANNVETILPIPAVFFPVRVSMRKFGILLKLKIVSVSDVRAAVMRTQTSFRRSRMPEN